MRTHIQQYEDTYTAVCGHVWCVPRVRDSTTDIYQMCSRATCHEWWKNGLAHVQAQYNALRLVRVVKRVSIR